MVCSTESRKINVLKPCAPVFRCQKKDLEANLGNLLHKDLEKVLLHVGTRNAAIDFQ